MDFFEGFEGWMDGVVSVSGNSKHLLYLISSMYSVLLLTDRLKNEAGVLVWKKLTELNCALSPHAGKISFSQTIAHAH